ncbi:Lysosomal alpha-mannosidase [Sarcoptes scabiei]|uniref:Alpha-mannosidase n=1 Tax=Sarcoptes scabiei TaxID=52283 RepID=A0A834RES1_SARSC|nr:Lysosomal alpha-mannosidase [Sarcoptes scabiei]
MYRLWNYLITATLLFVSIESVVIKLENLPERCDLSQCHPTKDGMINVHLVPHTHDDVGWLKTVDQYYYGVNNYVQKAGVQYILDTVVEELIRDKKRRFIYVETAFFWKWWQEQNQETKDIVKELVRTGQLEFINGGWTMPDEATTHYNSFIDQTSLGLKRLDEIFGNCGRPKVTWQIDPFGHSKELASLFSQMNYDALYFARQDYQDRNQRMSTKTLEHVWKVSDDLGTELFTGMMVDGYGPIEFDWDVFGSFNDAIVDNRNSSEYNVDQIIDRFVNRANQFQRFYATNHLMFPMGTDFHYQDAHVWFKNLDKLIKHVNDAGVGVNVLYSTPSCYTKALFEANRTWTTKTDDFFPYASDPNSVWSGYFTSRPALKRMERVGNNLLQACKQLEVLANLEDQEEKVTRLREAMGVMQHHDAVSGTEKQHVADSYAKDLSSAMIDCQEVIGSSIQKILHHNHTHIFCPLLNISSCAITESKETVAVYIYNPLGHKLENYTVRLPVNPRAYLRVFDAGASAPIYSVLVPIAPKILHLQERGNVSATKEIVFRANLEALSTSVYYLIQSEQKDSFTATEIEAIKISKEVRLSTLNDMEVIFNEFGLITAIEKEKQSIKFNQSFQYYRGANDFARNSGAYIFRPQEQHTFPVINDSRSIEAFLYQDKAHGLIQEVHQIFKNSFIEQIIRVDKFKDYIEFDYIVGPIPVDDEIGKEIVSRFETDLENEEKFYTDSNGRQMMERRWNYRPSWDYQVQEKVAGNYYPVVSRIGIKDHNCKRLQLMVLTDRSQGGSISPTTNGTIDLMVHRRLLVDDGFGVNEALNEPGFDGEGLVIRGRHLVLLENDRMITKKHRLLAQQMFMEPILSFSKTSDHYTTLGKDTKKISPLPENVHLLTLEKWNNEQYLLRLENFFQKQEDEYLSQPVNVSLKHLFDTFTIIEAQEKTLDGIHDIEDLERKFLFKSLKNEKISNFEKDREDLSRLDQSTPYDPPIGNDLIVTLYPMQIRTFLIKLARK